MTFEEANDRYLDILKQISYIENFVEKDTMYNLAYLTIGDGLRSCNGKLKSEIEANIAFFEKTLSDKED